MIKKVFFFSMEGCPHCQEMREMMDEKQIPYSIMDIDLNPDEYEEFKNIVDGNEYVPAFLCVNLVDGKLDKHLALAPERDFEELSEALTKIEEFVLN